MRKVKSRIKTNHKKTDTLLLAAILILLIFGIVMVYDASVVYAHDLFGGKYYFLILQSLWVLLALIGFGFMYSTDYHVLLKYSTPLFVLSLLFLGFVLLPTIFTPIIYGARRWIYLNPQPLPTIPLIGRLGFQPSELFKLSFVVYFSFLLSKKEKFSPIAFLVLILLVLGLIMLQPDLGTALIIGFVAMVIYFVSGANILYFFSGIPFFVGSLLLLILTSPYRKERLLTYLGGNTGDSQGASYHINQILIALGSGGLFGLGFGQSRQKYQYIPEVVTDSIFAVIGEELGFLGLTLLVLLFLVIIVRGFRIAKLAPDKVGKLIATGVTSWFAIQTFVNLAGMVHLIPLTGVPLPLISYGGSSLVFGLMGLGMLLNVGKQCQKI